MAERRALSSAFASRADRSSVTTSLMERQGLWDAEGHGALPGTVLLDFAERSLSK